MITKNCLSCKKEFLKPYTCSKKVWLTRKFCSKKCANNTSKNGEKNKDRPKPKHVIEAMKPTMFKKGHAPWNKEKELSETHIKNLSISHKGQVPWCKDKKLSKEHIINLSVSHINSPNRVFKDTKIELKMEELLKNLGIEYRKQVPLLGVAVVDFYIPSKKLVIQCDGCYWHGCSIHFPNFHQDKKGRDVNQDKILEENEIKVLRFWEHEIMSDNFLIKINSGNES